MKPEDIEVEFLTQEEDLWQQVEKEAQEELDKAERNYFRITTFQKAVLKLAKQELANMKK